MVCLLIFFIDNWSLLGTVMQAVAAQGCWVEGAGEVQLCVSK